MTRIYTLEVHAEDDALIDRPSDVSYTISAFVPNNGAQVSVFETLDEHLAAQWTHILDDEHRAYVARTTDGRDVISQQCVREPPWRIGQHHQSIDAFFHPSELFESALQRQVAPLPEICIRIPVACGTATCLDARTPAHKISFLF